jgi:hypothetical protein
MAAEYAHKLSVVDPDPGQVLFGEDVPLRLKFGRPIERANVEMGFGRQARTFAGQSRAAPGAKPAPRSSRRRIELCYLALRDSVSRAFECDKNRSRRAAMPAAALAMAPIDTFRLPGRNKPDSTAQAAARELVGCAAHELDPPLD